MVHIIIFTIRKLQSCRVGRGSDCSHCTLQSLQSKFNFTSGRVRGGGSDCSQCTLQSKFNFTSGGGVQTVVNAHCSHCSPRSTSLPGGGGEFLTAVTAQSK